MTATYKSKSAIVNARVSENIENEIVVSWRDAHRLGTVVINGLNLEPENNATEEPQLPVTRKPETPVTRKPEPVPEPEPVPVPEAVTGKPETVTSKPEPVPEPEPEPAPEPGPATKEHPAPLQESASAICRRLAVTTEPAIVAQITPAYTHGTFTGASPDPHRNLSRHPTNPRPTLGGPSQNPHLNVDALPPDPCSEPHQTPRPTTPQLPEPEKQTSLGQILHEDQDKRRNWVKNEYHDSGSDSDSDADENADSAAFIRQDSCSDDDTNVGEEQGVTESDNSRESGESNYESAAEDLVHAPWVEPEHELEDVPDETDSDGESGESEYESAAEDPMPTPQAERTHDGSGDPEKNSHQEITEETRSFVYWLLSQVKVLGATEFLRYRTLLKKLCQQLSTGTQTTKTTTMGQTPPSRPVALVQPAAPTSIKEHTGTSLIEVNMDSNGDGSGLTYWTIFLISAATLLLVYVIRRFMACRKRANEKRDAEAARNARVHALALMPRNHVDGLNDRFVELDINEQRQPPPRDIPEVEANAPRRQRR